MTLGKVLPATKLQMAEHARNSWFVVVPNDTTKDDVLTPAYWQNQVRELMARPFARIEVVREDGTMDLDLRCIDAKPGYAKMRVLREFVDDRNLIAAKKAAEAVAGDAEALAAEVPEGYKLGHLPTGANRGHWVKLTATGETIRGGFPDRASALAFANAHKREAETIPA